ncbi:MAG: indolepyruvate oxidoreductase subunit beta [Candidatus Bathyarchaeia archaeon]
MSAQSHPPGGVANMASKELNILVAGVGGQGNLLASEIIASAAVREGLKVRVAEVFGAAQRGGAVVSHIRIGPTVYSPLISEGQADIVLGFEPVECLRTAKFLSSVTTIIMNASPVIPVSVSLGLTTYPDYNATLELLRRLTSNVIAIDATDLAKKAGHAMMMNVVMVGALAGANLTPIATERFTDAISSIVRKGAEAMNHKAFEYGINAI